MSNNSIKNEFEEARDENFSRLLKFLFLTRKHHKIEIKALIQNYNILVENEWDPDLAAIDCSKIDNIPLNFGEADEFLDKLSFEQEGFIAYENQDDSFQM